MRKTFKIILIAALAFFTVGNGFAQPEEHLIPLRSNPIQFADAHRFELQRSSMAFLADTIVFPSTGLHDDFSYNSNRPDTSLWDLSFSNPPLEIEPSGVFINRTWAIAPINLGVCTFDGIKWNGQPYNDLANVNSTGRCDDLVSKPINLSARSVADSVYLSFWYEPQGRGYAPNAQDSFLLDFNIPAWNPDQFTTVWKNVWFTEGYTPSLNDTNFHLVLIKLDSASYFTNGFRFRFHNYASQCGSNDHWHLDEVVLKNNRSINDTLAGDVGFVYPPTSGLKDFQAVPHTHYKPSMMASNFNVQIRNNDLASRNITYWYYVYDETNTALTTYPNTTGAVDICPTYFSSGYMNSAAITNPTISYSYPQSPVNSDSTTFVIKHVLKENASTFDTCTTLQKFYNYYAYDDGSAEVGYGLYGQFSQLAYKFTMSNVLTQDTLKAIQMYFLPVQDISNLQERTFTLKVWADGGNQPGSVIYSQRTQSPTYNFETPNRFVSYGIDSGTVVLTAGQTYYIGWEQQAIDRLYIGFDFNDDHHDKIYYNTSGNWNTSIFNGSLMMRPVFGNVYPVGQDETGIQVQQASSAPFSIFPNPANAQITISSLNNSQGKLRSTILDISGRNVSASQMLADGTIDISSLSVGVYFIQLRNEMGELLGTQKFVKSY